MANNGKALLASAIAGLMVIGVAYWWNRRDDNPRPGCTSVVVTASVEKDDLMGEVAKRYNASDRQVNGSCYGIMVNAMASGLVESRLAEENWDCLGSGAGCLVTCGVYLAAAAPPRPLVARPAGHPAGKVRVCGLHADRPRDARADGKGVGLA